MNLEKLLILALILAIVYFLWFKKKSSQLPQKELKSVKNDTFESALKNIEVKFKPQYVNYRLTYFIRENNLDENALKKVYPSFIYTNGSPFIDWYNDIINKPLDIEERLEKKLEKAGFTQKKEWTVYERYTNFLKMQCDDEINRLKALLHENH